jgi:hypothetical protein
MAMIVRQTPPSSFVSPVPSAPQSAAYTLWSLPAVGAVVIKIFFMDISIKRWLLNDMLTTFRIIISSASITDLWAIVAGAGYARAGVTLAIIESSGEFDMTKRSNALAVVVGVGLVAAGAGLAYWGYQMSGSLTAQLTRTVSGSMPDEVIYRYIGGAVCAVVGVVLFLKG